MWRLNSSENTLMLGKTEGRRRTGQQRMRWLDLLAVHGTLKSLLQCYSSEASILLPSAFFIIQFSHPYMTTGKTIALTRWTFVDKVMSLLFNMLLRLVIGEGNGTPLQYSCWKIPWIEEPGWLQSMGSRRVRHDWATSLSLFTFMHSVQFSH